MDLLHKVEHRQFHAKGVKILRISDERKIATLNSLNYLKKIVAAQAMLTLKISK